MALPTSRPTSPHLQIYRLPLTGLISITHRITGVFLSVGLILVAAFLYALSKGPESYATLQHVFGFWLMRVFYWGFIFALFFHLCHGIRHLFWDLGEGFERNDLQLYAVYELLWAAMFTLCTWFFV